MRQEVWTESIVAIACFVLASIGSAQEQTGGLEGRVTDAAGRPLGGVTLEARSPVPMGVGHARSGTDGVYRFPSLPPGTYQVTCLSPQFASAGARHVVISAGIRVRLNITVPVTNLRPSTLSPSSPDSRPSTFTPSSSTSPTSPTFFPSSAAFANLERDTIDHLPARSRDFTAVVPLAPGGAAEPGHDEARIDGGAPDQRYFLDGVEVAVVGDMAVVKTVPLDFVSHVQVKASGHGAEFAGASGGIVSVMTKSGSNRFSGSAGSYFEAEWLLGASRGGWRINPFDDRTGELVTAVRDRWRHNSPVVDVGGPALPGRAWFYAGYGYDRNDYGRAAFFRDSPPPAARREFTWFDEAHEVDWNVSVKPADGLRVKVTGANRLFRRRRTAPSLQPAGSVFADGTPAEGFTTAPLDSEALAFDRRWRQSGVDRPDHSYSANLDWVASPSLVASITSAYSVRDARTPPAFYGHDTRHVFGTSNAFTDGIPELLRFPRGYVDHRTTDGIARKSVERLHLNGEGTWHRGGLGQHTVKFGVRADRVSSSENDGDQKPTVTLWWDRAYATGNGRLLRGPYGYYEVVQPRTFGHAVSSYTALWLQDSWALGRRATVEAGVRIEDEHAGSFTSDPGIDFGFGQKIAPRFGFAADLLGRGRSRLFGSYGIFYDTIRAAVATRSLGAISGTTYVYTLDTYDWRTIDCEAAASGCPGTFLAERGSVVAVNHDRPELAAFFGEPRNAIDPGLRPRRTGEFALGFDQALGRATTLGARYVREWLTRTVEEVQVTIPDAGDVPFVGNPGFGVTRVLLPGYPAFALPRARRLYDGVELRVTRRARAWTLSASYVLSALRGNYAGSASSDQGAYFDSPYASWDRNGREVSGRLPTDRPHLLKLNGSCDLRWGTSVGALLIAESGTPLSSRLSWRGGTVYFNGRGDLGRTPPVTQLDLLLEHQVRLAGRQRLSASVTISNLLDADTPTAFSTSPWRDTFDFPDAVFFGGWDPNRLVAQIRASGGTLRDNPIYLKPTSAQPPRQVRLGLKYVF